MKKILYFLYGGLGNSVLAYPAILNLLNNKFSITIITTSNSNEQFLKIAFKNYLNKQIKIIKLNNLNHLLLYSIKNKEKFTFLTSNLYAPFKRHALISKFIKAKYKIGLKNKNYFNTFNIKVNFIKKEKIGNLELIKPIIGKNPEIYKPKIKTKGKKIIIYPGSSKYQKEAKRWDKFPKLTKILKNNGFEIKIILGIDEIDLLNDYKNLNVEICIAKNIEKILTCFSDGKIFIGNDGGITHLASWYGLPTLIIFGPTDPQKNEPLGNFQIIRKKLPCSPCYKFKKIKCPFNYKCMKEISIEEVYSRFNSFLRYLPV